MSGWNASVQPHCQLYGPRKLFYSKHNSFLSPLVLAAKLSPWSISSLDNPSEACYFLSVPVLMSVHCLCTGQKVCGREKYMEEGCAIAFVSANKGQGLPWLGAFFRWCVCRHVFLSVNAIVRLVWVRNYHNCLWKCLKGSTDYAESQTPYFSILLLRNRWNPLKSVSSVLFYHGAVACDAIYYHVVLHSGRACELVLCLWYPPVPCQWLQLLKRQYPWNYHFAHVWTFFATGFSAD